jgi:hypothetical protein
MTESGSPISRRAAVARAASMFGMLMLPKGLARSRDPFPHPDPRPGISGEKVLKAADLGSSKKSVLEAYETARTHPEIFDGLYCVCECDENMGHRSLLGCFESRQAVGCWSCREQAELVAEMLKKGEGLEKMRKAFDAKWG